MSLLNLSVQLIVAHRGLNEIPEALELCFDMLETHDLNNNPRDTVTTMETIADIYLSQEEKLKAADTYRTIASIHSNFTHKTMAKKYIAKAEALEAEAA